MNRQEKLQQIEEFSELCGKTNLVVIVENKGLNAEQTTKLRKLVFSSGGQLRVFKNTFVGKGFGEDMPTDLEPHLHGPNAFLFGGENFIEDLKGVVDFSKTTKEKLVVKAGVLDGKYLDASRLQVLATLPGKDQMRAQLLGTMMAPVRGFVTALAGNVRNLLNVLNAIKENKE
jgi:large subunit ribosomal protein L10